MRRSLHLAVAAAFLLAAFPALSQTTHCDAPGTVDPAILERPTVLRTDVGHVSQKVTTSSPEANRKRSSETETWRQSSSAHTRSESSSRAQATSSA